MIVIIQSVRERRRHREVCGAVHQQCGVLNDWSEEAEQRHWWVPHQYQMAEKLLALGLASHHLYDDLSIRPS